MRRFVITLLALCFASAITLAQVAVPNAGTRVTDGTNTAQVTATSGGSLAVECTAGCGSAASSNILNVSVSESVAAPSAATWYLKRQWALPASAVFTPTRIWSSVTTAGSRTLIGIVNEMGSFNVSSNVFTDGNTLVSPRHYARLFACVTTVLSAVATNVTVTYTNETGTAGRTTTALVVPASAPVGNCLEFQLAATTGQMRDEGVRDVTAVSDTAAPTGVIAIFGLTALHDTLGVANANEQSDYDAGQLSANEQIVIMLMQAATTAQQRGAGISGSIR